MQPSPARGEGVTTAAGTCGSIAVHASVLVVALSSMNLPRNLIEIEWFRAVATINPVSYLIECIRSLIIVGWDGEALALGFGIALVLTVVSLALASVALRTRLARS